MQEIRKLIGFSFFLFLVIIISSCAPSQKLPVEGFIDLSQLETLEPVDHEIEPLRVAVASVVSPKGTIESYEPLLDYLGSQFNRPIVLIQRRTYLETNELIANGSVDLAFVCTSAYIEGVNKGQMELLVAPQVNGGTVYYSLIIVPSDSAAQTMQDLKGKKFAFTDPISFSGRMYPTYLVHNLGFTPEEFFSEVFFTYNHDEAIRAVANKIADGAAVDSLVYEYAIKRDSELSSKIRVIHTSPSFGIPPVVVSLKIDPELRLELMKVLLNMDQTESGLIALQSIGVEKFVLLDDNAYDEIRLLLDEIHSN